ncbi:MAG: hypothetical protein WDM96_13285 [Lacunisphaera sp.]
MKPNCKSSVSRSGVNPPSSWSFALAPPQGQGPEARFRARHLPLQYPPGEPDDEMLAKVYLGAANLAADKIEPILFPELKKADAKK